MRQMLSSSEQVQGFQHPPDSFIPERGSTSTSLTLRKSIISVICIPAAFMYWRVLRKKCGHIGADTSGSIAICRSRTTPMTRCMIW